MGSGHAPVTAAFSKLQKSTLEDVRSWLRWDGLISAVLAEAKRSKKAEWQSKLESSSKSIDCPKCLGTGLQLHSRTVMLGQRSLFEWVRKGTIGEFTEALREMNPANQRMRRRKQRILRCLQPLSKKIPQAPLRKPVNDTGLLRSVYGRTVANMTSLKLLKLAL